MSPTSDTPSPPTGSVSRTRQQKGSYESTIYWTRAEAETRAAELHSTGQATQVPRVLVAA